MGKSVDLHVETIPVKIVVHVPLDLYRQILDSSPDGQVGPSLARWASRALLSKKPRSDRGSKHHRPTSEQVTQLRLLVGEGMTVTKAAAEVGLKLSTASYHLKKPAA